MRGVLQRGYLTDAREITSVRRGVFGDFRRFSRGVFSVQLFVALSQGGGF